MFIFNGNRHISDKLLNAEHEIRPRVQSLARLTNIHRHTDMQHSENHCFRIKRASKRLKIVKTSICFFLTITILFHIYQCMRNKKNKRLMLFPEVIDV
jgi:hypothetical protein